VWKQIASVTLMNLSNLWQRWAASSVVVIGVAGVVGVLVSVMALATGLTRTLVDTGDADRAIVLRKSADTESISNLEMQPRFPDRWHCVVQGTTTHLSSQRR
jgi:putative ABC transport system permease protein